MRNMWTIFTRDIRKIRTNVIALIVVLGVTVVPCLYAWFNIAANWDPYSNTGNIKIAVANCDKGTKPDPAPAESWRSGIVCSSGEYTAQLGIYDQKQSNEGCKIRRILCCDRNP